MAKVYYRIEQLPSGDTTVSPVEDGRVLDTFTFPTLAAAEQYVREGYATRDLVADIQRTAWKGLWRTQDIDV